MDQTVTRGFGSMGIDCGKAGGSLSLYDSGGSQADWQYHESPRTVYSRAMVLSLSPDVTRGKLYRFESHQNGKYTNQYFTAHPKPEDGWGDLPIGTIFAGGENGELLEVIGRSTTGFAIHAPLETQTRKDGQ